MTLPASFRVRRPRRRPAVVVTVSLASSALLAAACGGSVTDSGGGAGGSGAVGGSGGTGNVSGSAGTGGNPPRPECTEVTEEGEPCGTPGATCNVSRCRPPTWLGDLFLTCDGSRWELVGQSSCNPPRPECPPSLPAQGSACGPEGAHCTYSGGECCPAQEARCLQGQWQTLISTCNPPPPLPCPEAEPVAGTSCLGDRCDNVWRECPYGLCGGTSLPRVVYSCGEQGVWVASSRCVGEDPGGG